MELLESLGIVPVGLPTGYGLDMARIDHHEEQRSLLIGVAHVRDARHQ